jgi:anti-sigma regulatory factor (Ser/Thr protein kinase)
MEQSWPAEARSVALARHAVLAFATGMGVAGPLQERVALAVTEAFTNAVLHAYRDRRQTGAVAVCARIDGGYLEVVVRDTGVGLVSRVDSPGAGLGLPLIASLADHVDLGAGEDGGTRLCMCFAMGQPPPATSV